MYVAKAAELVLIREWVPFSGVSLSSWPRAWHVVCITMVPGETQQSSLDRNTTCLAVNQRGQIQIYVTPVNAKNEDHISHKTSSYCYTVALLGVFVFTEEDKLAVIGLSLIPLSPVLKLWNLISVYSKRAAPSYCLVLKNNPAHFLPKSSQRYTKQNILSLKKKLEAVIWISFDKWFFLIYFGKELHNMPSSPQSN